MNYVLVGLTPVLLYASWPLIVHFYRHGMDNHDCGRAVCCPWSTSDERPVSSTKSHPGYADDLMDPLTRKRP